MTSETKVTYTSTRPPWSFWFDTGVWLGVGLTLGFIMTAGSILTISGLILRLAGVLS